MDRRSREVRVRNPAASGGSEPPRTFTMDNVFDESLSQQIVYDETCRPIVANIIGGYNGTVFAVRHTHTHDTYTARAYAMHNTKGGFNKSHVCAACLLSFLCLVWVSYS